ncbi:MAG: polysulfide reductase NrfD [Actinobacteria bacterium]|nr:polysulfide reductase NrfD [Actinomycetota bacterium]
MTAGTIPTTEPKGGHQSTGELPQKIGQLSPSWIVFFVAMLAVTAVGFYAYLLQVNNGLIVTGLRGLGTMAGATWGLYVAYYVYFIGVSFAGITVAALIRIFRIEKLEPVARIGELLTVVSLILGALAIMADLEHPWRAIVNLFKYGRPQSPFFGTFTMVIAGYLFASLVYLYVTSRRDAALLAERDSRFKRLYRFLAAGYTDTRAQRRLDRRVTFWLAITILPLLVIAHSTVGFVFGLQAGRPGWFGALQAPGFVVLAGVSGIGNLIMLAAIVRSATRTKGRITIDAFSWLGKLLLGLLITYLYFTAVEILTITYQPGASELTLSEALLSGTYAWIFWGAIASLVIAAVLLIWQALTRRWSIGLVVATGVLVNIGAVAKRYLIVVPSQTHGQLLPYSTGTYTPNWVEWAIVFGLFALGALMIGVFMKIFPIVPLEETDTP